MTEIRTSQEIGEIAKALAAAQAELENVAKDAANPHFKSRYATLAGVLSEVRPKLAKHGVSLFQAPINGEGSNIGVMTRLMHSSGQWLESAIFVQPTKFDAQGVGSVLTYLRRYSAMAAAGVGPEDDDAEAAVGRPAPRAAPQPRPTGVNGSHLPANPEEPPAVNAERERIRKLIATVKQHIDTAPNVDVLDTVMDDDRKAVAQIEAAGPAGVEAANTLRARYNQRVAQLRGGQ